MGQFRPCFRGERLETIGDLGKRSALRCVAQLLRGGFQVGGDPFLFESLALSVLGRAGVAPTAASCIASMAEITSWAQ